MRKIENIFVHCTGGSAFQTVEDILAEFAKKPWRVKKGYHKLVARDGKVTILAKDSEVVNGVMGFNKTALHISYIGGVDEEGKITDTRTPEQKASIEKELKDWKKIYMMAKIKGHRDASPDTNGNGIVDPWERIKECPCFDAITEYKHL